MELPARLTTVAMGTAGHGRRTGDDDAHPPKAVR
jgi:hypothetical protein